MILYRSGTSTGALLAEDCPASIHASLLCRLRALEGLCPVDGIVVAAFANRRQRPCINQAGAASLFSLPLSKS